MIVKLHHNFAWSHCRAFVSRLAGVSALTGLMFFSSQALAQSSSAYPSKPIRIVVNFAAGGGVDLIGRTVATGLQNSLGWTTVVENRPGAGGNLGADLVAKSAPDGYTLLVTNGGTLHTNPHIYKAMPLDPLRDLVPIAELARIPNLLVTRKAFPANNVPEFMAYLRANPGKVTLATQGTGTTSHMSGEMLTSMSGVSLVQVPYKGTSAVFPDLMGDRVDFFFDGGAAVPYIRNGDLKLLAVTSASRLQLFPDTPALNEAGGVPGFVFDSAHTILAPAGTPKEIITVLNREVLKVMGTPEVKRSLLTMNLEVIGNSPEDAAASIAAEHKRIGDLVKKIGLTPN
jgi:tripartite-type tricarboxylate transporter receptor subunit TctC